jgi:hypothetical protein
MATTALFLCTLIIRVFVHELNFGQSLMVALEQNRSMGMHTGVQWLLRDKFHVYQYMSPLFAPWGVKDGHLLQCPKCAHLRTVSAAWPPSGKAIADPNVIERKCSNKLCTYCTSLNIKHIAPAADWTGWSAGALAQLPNTREWVCMTLTKV